MNYLGSQTVTSTVEEILGKETASGENDTQQLPPGIRVSVRTSRSWLKKLSLHHHTVSKDVCIDEYERKDLVEYRQREFYLRGPVLKDKGWYFLKMAHGPSLRA